MAKQILTGWWCSDFGYSAGVPTFLGDVDLGYSGKSADEFCRSDNVVVWEGDCLLKMSCNGCRVLRKGCSESCILRPCLQWIDSADAQGHATVFVAKFFGRAGLMGFINAVPETQRRGMSNTPSSKHLFCFKHSACMLIWDNLMDFNSSPLLVG